MMGTIKAAVAPSKISVKQWVDRVLDDAKFNVPAEKPVLMRLVILP